MFGLNMVVAKGKTIVVGDTSVNEYPSSEELAEIAISSARVVKMFGFVPKVAFVSHSTFGQPLTSRTKHIKKAVEIFAQGVEAVKQRGKADVGEKTMMDVLIPVSNCLQKGLEENRDKSEILNEAIEVAEKGMLSTKDLSATKGRASFLGERAKGHIDPGARSSQLMIKTVCESVNS